MKKFFLFLLFLALPVCLLSQEHSGITAVGELSDGLVAIQKDGNWGFIDQNGNMVIDYRNDLVADKTSPLFHEGRCLIQKDIDGIRYYGYIDTRGNTVVAPVYLNATPFKDGYAIVLKVEEQVRGTNQYLNKDIIDRNFDEVLINTNGDEIRYLTPHKGVMLDAKKYKQPEIVSRVLSSGLVAFMDEKGQWKVLNIPD